MRAGDRVGGRFELLTPTGRGGTAIVWRAVDTEDGAKVAVKLFRELSPNAVERFGRESRLLAELSHPGIVRYLAHGADDDGDAWLAMEWLEGIDLAQRLAQPDGLGLDESVGLVLRAAEALAVAHARGVVHRDVKPSNLFLVDGDPRRVKVLDFGIARLTARAGDLTRTGVPMGTPGYMAPEQARGEPDVDVRADVFSLGCVLFECLTGQAPFVGDHAIAVLSKILFETASRVREVRSDIPEALDELIARMLSKGRSERPSDAAVVARELAVFGSLSTGREVSASVRLPVVLTEREQRLVSIVLARAGRIGWQRQAELAQLFPPDRARVEVLADGTVVTLVTGPGTPAEQAALAARCALRLREVLGDVPMVLSTGRAVVAGRLPVGDVIDRAVAALPAVSLGVARLDGLTSGLLASSFEIAEGPDGRWLVGERPEPSVSRTLLGREVPCVGRDRELAILEATYAACVEGPKASVVVVTGPAGVGKSRLRDELLLRIARRGDPPWLLAARAESMGTGGFGMIGAALRRAAGLRQGDPLAAQRSALEGWLGPHLVDAPPLTIEVIADLVGIVPEEEASPELRASRRDPLLIAARRQAAFVALVDSVAKTRGVVLVLDDLHWGDATAVQLVDAVLERLEDASILVLALARSEVHTRFPSLWESRSRTEIKLRGLGKRASEEFVRAALGDDAAGETVDALVRRADGNPFYLEELIRAVAEGGQTLPETVLGMVQARFDALSADARRALRAASVFGETFWRGGLLALLGGDARIPHVEQQLVELEARELIVPRAESAIGGERELAFRHALVREAAYASLTDEDRRLAHRAAARWLEQAGWDDALVIGRHLEHAGRPERAARMYLRAARAALEASEVEEAIERANRGIACGAEREARGELFEVQARAHRWAGRYSDAEACASQALALLPKGSAAWFSAGGALACAAGPRGSREPLLAWATELAATRAAAEPARRARLVAACETVRPLVQAGQYDLAESLLTDVARDVVAEKEPEIAGRLFAERGFRALHLADLGVAVASYREAIRWLDAARDVRTACMVRGELGYVQVEIGQAKDGAAVLSDALSSAHALALSHARMGIEHNYARALARLGVLEEAIDLQASVADQYEKSGHVRLAAGSRVNLAEALLDAGRVDAAAKEIARAIELSTTLAPMRATALTIRARIELERGEPDTALATCREALDLVEQLRGMEEGEAVLRLVHARALHATGAVEEAKYAIRYARDRVVERAERIAEADLRRAFLESVPENAQTLALAAEWDRDEGSSPAESDVSGP